VGKERVYKSIHRRDDEKINLLWDLALLISRCFWLPETGGGGVKEERTGQDQRCFYLPRRISADAGKTTLGRKDEVVERKRDKRFS
jgi:hypothetical protein